MWSTIGAENAYFAQLQKVIEFFLENSITSNSKTHLSSHFNKNPKFISNLINWTSHHDDEQIAIMFQKHVELYLQYDILH